MRILYTITIAFIALSAWAQPTITSNAAPSPGTVWSEVSFEFPTGISLGDAGPNQTWDFSNPIGDSETDALNFISPSELPSGFNGMFDNATLATYADEDSSAQFFASTGDGFYVVGFATLSQDAPPPYNMTEFSPPNLFMPYNYTYLDVRNNQSSNTLTLDNGVPLQLRSTIFTEYTADGYGTVSTPAGTFNNALRMQTSSYSIDSVFVDTDLDGVFEFVSTDGPSDSQLTYYYLQNSAPSVIAIIDLDEDQVSISNFSYLLVGSVGLDESTILDLDVFPNPSTGSFTIKDDFKGLSTVSLKDLNGREVYLESFQSSGNTRTIEVSDLPAGIYLVELRTAEGVAQTRLTIE